MSRESESAEPTDDLAAANERLLLAGLREQELAEQANRRAEELKAVLESLDDAVAVFDARGEMAFLNAAALRMFGPFAGAVSAQALVDQVQLLRPDAEPLRFREAVLRPALAGEPTIDCELDIRPPSGIQRRAVLKATPIRSDHGNVILVMCLFQDITELRELERTREQYLSMMSHDLRGPLLAVRILAELLERDQTLPEPARSHAEKILRATDRLDRMMCDLLDAQLIRSGGRLPLRPARADLLELTREAIDDLEVVHGERFEVDGPEALFGVWGADEVRRAIWNLAGNAARHGRPMGLVRIRLTRTDSGARISVHNEGRPIPASDQARLFNPFVRSAPEGQRIGWGLGLTLVRGCAEAHGGSIEVRSDEAHGTTFTLSLPLAPPGWSATGEPAATAPDSSHRRTDVRPINSRQRRHP